MLLRFRQSFACRRFLLLPALLAVGCLIIGGGWMEAKEYLSGVVWPKVKVISPHTPGEPPSDAIVLFDGTDMSQWHGGQRWIIEDGAATVAGGGVTSKQAFGSCQVHLEWASPEKVKGEGQGRGNSGIHLMGHYELQILDSYENETYPDGQAAAIYKQQPPLVNVCRAPGEWQSYDIIFNAPKFSDDGTVERPATMTVLHNGVLVQNHFELTGETAWHKPPAYTKHADKLPLKLQFHGNPVRFRNIWVREL